MAQTVFPAEMVAVVSIESHKLDFWALCNQFSFNVAGPSALERRDFSESIRHSELGDWTGIDRDMARTVFPAEVVAVMLALELIYVLSPVYHHWVQDLAGFH